MNEKQNLRLKRNVGLDYVHTFLSNMNMQSSIWVLYLAYCGLHLAQIGLLEGIYHATSIVCEIPSGAAADLWGQKTLHDFEQPLHRGFLRDHAVLKKFRVVCGKLCRTGTWK